MVQWAASEPGIRSIVTWNHHNTSYNFQAAHFYRVTTDHVLQYVISGKLLLQIAPTRPDVIKLGYCISLCPIIQSHNYFITLYFITWWELCYSVQPQKSRNMFNMHWGQRADLCQLGVFEKTISKSYIGQFLYFQTYLWYILRPTFSGKVEAGKYFIFNKLFLKYFLLFIGFFSFCIYARYISF